MLLPLLISMRLRVKQTNKKTLAVKKVCVCVEVCAHIYCTWQRIQKNIQKTFKKSKK